MLQKLLSNVPTLILIVALWIYWFAPRVEIDSRPAVTDGEILVPKATVKRVIVDRIFVDKLKAAESIDVNPETGDLYTGTIDGMLWKIKGDLSEAEEVMRSGENLEKCGTVDYLSRCGRILGLKYIGEDKLVVADSYLGIMAIHLKMGKKEILVQPDENLLTKSIKFFNSVDVSDDGIVYFTISSMKWDLSNVLYSFLELDSTGRLYSYNLVTRELSLIAANLSFANGLVISHDKNFLIMSDLFKRRILKIDIRSPGKEVKVLIDKLPGYPDNIRKGAGDSYYVAMPFLYSKMSAFIERYPSLRYWLAWLVPKWIMETTLSHTGSEIYKFDSEGNVQLIIKDEKNEIVKIAEAFETKDKLVLASYANKYLGVVSRTDF